MVDTDEDNSATTRSSGYAHATGTTMAREKFKGQGFPDTTLVVSLSCGSRFLTLPFRQTVRKTVVASARPGTQAQPECVLEKTQLDVAVADSWALESKGRGRPLPPVGVQTAGPNPHTAQYVVERDDTGARRRGYVSTQGAHVHEIEKNAIQSLHGDMVQIQPSKMDDVPNDPSVSRFASQQSR